MTKSSKASGDQSHLDPNLSDVVSAKSRDQDSPATFSDTNHRAAGASVGTTAYLATSLERAGQNRMVPIRFQDTAVFRHAGGAWLYTHTPGTIQPEAFAAHLIPVTVSVADQRDMEKEAEENMVSFSELIYKPSERIFRQLASRGYVRAGGTRFDYLTVDVAIKAVLPDAKPAVITVYGYLLAAYLHANGLLFETQKITLSDARPMRQPNRSDILQAARRMSLENAFATMPAPPAIFGGLSKVDVTTAALATGFSSWLSSLITPLVLTTRLPSMVNLGFSVLRMGLLSLRDSSLIPETDALATSEYAQLAANVAMVDIAASYPGADAKKALANRLDQRNALATIANALRSPHLEVEPLAALARRFTLSPLKSGTGMATGLFVGQSLRIPSDFSVVQYIPIVGEDLGRLLSHQAAFANVTGVIAANGRLDPCAVASRALMAHVSEAGLQESLVQKAIFVHYETDPQDLACLAAFYLDTVLDFQVSDQGADDYQFRVLYKGTSHGRRISLAPAGVLSGDLIWTTSPMVGLYVQAIEATASVDRVCRPDLPVDALGDALMIKPEDSLLGDLGRSMTVAVEFAGENRNVTIDMTEITHLQYIAPYHLIRVTASEATLPAALWLMERIAEVTMSISSADAATAKRAKDLHSDLLLAFLTPAMQSEMLVGHAEMLGERLRQTLQDPQQIELASSALRVQSLRMKLLIVMWAYMARRASLITDNDFSEYVHKVLFEGDFFSRHEYTDHMKMLGLQR